MFAVTVTFSIRLGQQAAFMQALEAHIRAAVAEDTGCLRAEALGDAARPGKVMLLQTFETSGDFEAYRASPLARSFDSAVVDIVTARAIATWGEVIAAERAR
ncbi:MAG: antibiotic biosynthesis monooxygenase family protein [Paracoccaceae bacterium]|nr:antibiotic biosynthesis monooxygenase family protein [Paracoccaceae bacterium]